MFVGVDHVKVWGCEQDGSATPKVTEFVYHSLQVMKMFFFLKFETGCVGGRWVDGWMDVVAVLGIVNSKQKTKFNIDTFFIAV